MQTDQAAALKEWAVAVDALSRGEQILIMRKGGIREETRDFTVESDRFYFYPTYEHQRKELVKPAYAPRVEEAPPGWSAAQTVASIGVYAEVVEDLLVETQEVLDRLREFHIWNDRLAEERLKWKRTKPLHVMLLRVYTLDEPVTVPVLPEYNGCKSWIGLPAANLEQAARRPVLSDAAFELLSNRIKKAVSSA